MKHYLFAAFLAVAPAASFAHGPLPPAQHGGTVVEASDEHVLELVLTGNQMTVYVSGEANKSVSNAHLDGKATVLVGGKSQQVTLVPAEANSLTGKLDTAASGKVTSVISLTIDGKPAQVRFTTIL